MTRATFCILVTIGSARSYSGVNGRRRCSACAMTARDSSTPPSPPRAKMADTVNGTFSDLHAFCTTAIS